jgi:hypothetical protein
MNSTYKYVWVNDKQAEVLNEYFMLSSDDDNAFYDGCELLLDYEYSIEDTSFGHEFGNEESYSVEIGNVYAVIDEEKVHIDDLFDLTPDQLDKLQDHAFKEAEDSFEESDYEDEE